MLFVLASAHTFLLLLLLWARAHKILVFAAAMLL